MCNACDLGDHARGDPMPASVFRFIESWELPGARVEDVYDVLAHGELLPLCWKGVYLEAAKLTQADEPQIGAKLRARGFLPFVLNFVIEARELEPPRRVSVKTSGDLDGALERDAHAKR
jgi:hypothetical protein